MPASHPAETLLIEGPDAVAFAHAQFSSNVAVLETGHWQYSAWLDPQGRVRALFHLARIADGQLLVLLRGGSAAAMADALRRFVFRSKLAITAQAPRALAGGPALSMHVLGIEDDILSLGCGTHSMRIIASDDGDSQWRQPQMRDGWAWLSTQSLDALLPPTLSLQRLQAVMIDKGCYPGQEIVARLHYRGGHKRHLHRVELSRCVAAGDVLRIDGRDAGCAVDTICTDAHCEALVVLSDDIVANAIDGQLNTFDDDLVIRLLKSWPA